MQSNHILSMLDFKLSIFQVMMSFLALNKMTILSKNDSHFSFSLVFGLSAFEVEKMRQSDTKIRKTETDFFSLLYQVEFTAIQSLWKK